MIKRILIIFLIVILVLFLGLIGGSYFLLGTDSGFRWTTQKIKTFVPDLVIAPTSGNLESGIQTDEISWKREGLQIDANGIESKWDSRCLIKYKYCLQKLSINKIKIKTRSPENTTAPAQKSIELPEINLPVDIEADEILIKKLVIDTADDVLPIELENIRLSASTQGSKLDLRNLSVVYKNYTLALSSNIELTGDYPLSAQLSLFAGKLIDDKDIQATVSISNSLRDLDIAGTVTGAVDLKLRGLVEPLEPDLPLNLNVFWEAIGWPLDSFENMKSTDGYLYLQGTMADYTMEAKTSLAGNQIPDSTVELKGLVNPKRALMHTVNILTLDGFLTGSAAASWDSNTTWIAQLIAKDINPGAKWADMTGSLNGLFDASGHARDGQWTLDLSKATIEGSLRNFPFVLDTQITKSADDVWTIKHMNLDNGPNKLAVTGSVAETLDINAKVNFPATHYLIPTVAGNLSGDIHLAGSVQAPDIKLDINSSVLRTPQALFRKLKLHTDIKETFEEKSVVHIDVGIVNINAQELKNLNIDLKGTKSDHSVVSSIDGPEKTSVTLSATGSLTPTMDWAGEISRNTITLPGQKWTLRNTLPLAWKQEQKEFTVSAHCWAQGKARLCLDNNLKAKDSGLAKISLKNFTLANLNSYMPATTRLAGGLNASSVIKWGGSQAPFQADIGATIDQATINVSDEQKGTVQFKYNKLVLKAQATPTTINAELDINSASMGNGQVSLTMNPKNKTQSIVGDVALKGFNIGFLKGFLPDFKKVDGDISVVGSVSGSLSDPAFNGRIDLKQPIVQSESLPLSIDGGNIALLVKGSEATLEGSLKAAQGTVKLGGSLSWLNKNVIANMKIDGDSLVIVQNPIQDSIVNPALRIRYTKAGLSVLGKVDVPRAQINIKELPEGTTSLSDDVIVIEDEIEEKKADQASGMPISINVGVSLGDEVKLAGYGIDASLTGDFEVAKTGQDPPQMVGEILITEGFYKSYGQDLSIENGQLLFVGPIDQTTLDIDATRTIESEERTVGLHLAGPIQDPVVTLFTDPADKTQESILSYLVLGRDLGGGNTDSESNLLASAALALTLKGGRGIATDFASSLGISDFAVDAGGSGDDTQVVVSGRLSSKLLLRYGRSVFNNQDTLFLRYDIGKRLYLEAAQGLERAVDVFYSFSF